MLEVEIEGESEPVITLDNATLQFVPPPTAAVKGSPACTSRPGEQLAAPRELHICGMNLTVEGATPA